MTGRRLEALCVTDTEMMALAARPKTAQALAARARIILACAEGVENQAVGQQLGVHPQTVGKWRRRFLAQRVEGLRDEPRPGAPRTIEDEQIEARRSTRHGAYADGSISPPANSELNRNMAGHAVTCFRAGSRVVSMGRRAPLCPAIGATRHNRPVAQAQYSRLRK
jgi:transposase-like protein